MITKKIIFILCLLTSQSVFLHSQIWYFGSNGGLDFSSGAPVSIDGGLTSHQEGVGVQYDCNGDLLFYTNGLEVWDSLHSPITGGPMTGSASMAQVLTCPKPGTDGMEYYIFHGTPGNAVMGSRMYYSIVNLGTKSFTVIDQELPTVSGPIFFEGITLVAHSNGDDFWLLNHFGSSDQFNIYLIDGVSGTNGITWSSSENIGASMSLGSVSIGYMATAKNNDQIAYANGASGNVEVFAFDNTIGDITGLTRTFSFGANSWTYGVDFSPNGDYVFIGRISGGGLEQGNISTGTTTTLVSKRIGAVRRGPDDKIYTATIWDSDLGVVNDPNNWGAAANWDPTALGGAGLGVNQVQDGLPTIPPATPCPIVTCPTPKDSTSTIALCFGDSLVLTTGAVKVSGTYYDTIMYADTCDHYYMEYDLTILDDVTIESETFTIVAGDSIQVEGIWYYGAAFITNTFQYASGSCDSLTRYTQINVLIPCPAAKDSTSTIVLCFGDSLELSYGAIKMSGTYYDTLYADTCEEYHMVYDLTILDDVSPESETFTILAGDSIEVDNIWYFNDTVLTNTYQYTNMSCDSLTHSTQIIVLDPVPPELPEFIIPNVFTPNDDGVNDLLVIENSFFSDVEVGIYNRWGHQVYSDTDQKYWDGTIGGAAANEGTYYYIIKAVGSDGEIIEYTGPVTLKR